MSEKVLIDKIKQGGYWRIAITPGEYVENRYTHNKLKEMLKESQISLRGWNYPHIDSQKTYNRVGFVESFCEFKNHLECLRFYRSGKFVHLFAMREEALNPEYLVQRFSWYTSGALPDKLRGFSILGALYTLTEIFEFVCNVAQKGAPLPGGKLDLELHGLKNRALYFDDLSRDLRQMYICRDECLSLSLPIPLGVTDEQFARKTACDWLGEIVQHFQWDGEHFPFFEAEQSKFLQSRR
ncbi:MAG TPA: hypothetical protein PK523_00420 [Elusimicrobiales bacterium]|nr:hypothetical protein [Elusimicrobiales bacterium]